MVGQMADQGEKNLGKVDASGSVLSVNKPARVDWIDYSKGLCMILVVMMHTVNNYEYAVGAEGWLRPVVDFAQPFRMPDFFLIAGFFLHRSINSDIKPYVDRKIIHFLYFYTLWMVILTAVREPGMLLGNPLEFVQSIAWAFIEPVGALWFLHMLAVFYIFVRVTRNVPTWMMVVFGVAMNTIYHSSIPETGAFVIDQFMDRFIYFYVGYAFAKHIFKIADDLRPQTSLIIGGLLVWGVVNWYFAKIGMHHVPVVAPIFGLVGAGAVCALGVLMAKYNVGNAIRYVGQNSLIVYLTFFIPMKFGEMVLTRVGEPLGSIGLATAIILVGAVAIPLIFARLIRSTPLNFLYVRPDFLKLTAQPSRTVSQT